MKRIFLGIFLSCAVLLLSACPDTKLPTPSPKVPEPKALGATLTTGQKVHEQVSTSGPLLRTAVDRA